MGRVIERGEAELAEQDQSQGTRCGCGQSEYLKGEVASSQLAQGEDYLAETTQYSQSFTFKVSIISSVVALLLSNTSS